MVLLILFYRAIQILCDSGADHLLTDIEGNSPKDLAEKHHHSKCSKYLASREKNRLSNPRTINARRVCDVAAAIMLMLYPDSLSTHFHVTVDPDKCFSDLHICQISYRHPV